jgi:TetR/AcrR family transcriptional regulator
MKVTGEGGGTRLEILRAAIRVLGRKSYSDMSMQDVAEASGFTKPTIYYYFTSKKGLVLALVEHVNSCLEDLLRRELAQTCPVSLSLERIAGAIIDMHSADEDFARAHLTAHSDTGMRALVPAMAEKFTELQRLLEELITRGVSSGEIRPDVSVPVLCRIYSSILHASLTERALGTETTPSAREMIGLLMRGIGS